jgi:hypothetical protein
MVDNIAFIVEKMDQGFTIIDIGPSPLRSFPLIESPFYGAEITHIANYNAPSIPYEHYRIDPDTFGKLRP